MKQMIINVIIRLYTTDGKQLLAVSGYNHMEYKNVKPTVWAEFLLEEYCTQTVGFLCMGHK